MAGGPTSDARCYDENGRRGPTCAPGGAFLRREVVAMDEMTRLFALLVLMARLSNEIVRLIKALGRTDSKEPR